MTVEVSFTPAARLEIIEAFDWYESRAAGLGVAFQAELGRQVERISENALQFPVMVQDVRRARLSRFPYSLFFRTIDERAFVLACFHASRNPREWEGRT